MGMRGGRGGEWKEWEGGDSRKKMGLEGVERNRREGMGLEGREGTGGRWMGNEVKDFIKVPQTRFGYLRNV